MPAVSAYDLELPALETAGLERSESLAAIRQARAENWLARTPVGFMLVDYRDAVAVLRDRRFHSALTLLPEMAGLEPDTYLQNRRRSILAMEGEEHARLRRLVAPAFTPAATDRLRPFMREVVSGLVDAVEGRGRCELVADVCEPYPIPIICELLGAPKEDWKLFSEWATDIFRIFNQNLAADLPAIQRASGALESYVLAMVEQRRTHPGDDLLSSLIAIEEAGDRLSSDELVMLAEAVLMAGTDTTRNQLACSVALLCEHPDQWALLAERPELAGRAVEETMRYLGAVRGTVRVASVDVEYRDVLFPAGTIVSIALAGANVDPDVFTSPDTFDITSERDAVQLTFGSGIHFCMGAALARAELQEALPLLARRMPDLALDGAVEWKPASFGIWGPARLPLRFGSSAT
ncbi:MAG TPA: cytochrome P450 [Acidimicrobiales bacterium]